MTKILIVDDNPANLSTINGILSGIYKVYAVSSGEMALKLLVKQRPDLILLDIEMPVMNGIELLCVLKADSKYSKIPVIFLTIQNDIDVEANAFKLGAVDYIRKPVNDIVLLSRVKMHLELEAYRSVLGITGAMDTNKILSHLGWENGFYSKKDTVD